MKCQTCLKAFREKEKFSTFPGRPIFHTRDIRYFISDSTSDMPISTQESAVANAFGQIEDVFDEIARDEAEILNLTIPSDERVFSIQRTMQRENANIVINFAKNGDADLPEKFESGVLGYAYAPQEDYSEIWINDAYRWATNFFSFNQNIVPFLVHEAGHSFGLGHSEDIQDIMYFRMTRNGKITEDFSNGILSLYGDQIKEAIRGYQSEPELPTAPAPVPQPPEKEPDVPEDCPVLPTMRFQKGASFELKYPLTSIPNRNSTLASPRIGQDLGVPRPTFPGEVGFADELAEVVEVRHDVIEGNWPGWFLDKYSIQEEPTQILAEVNVETADPVTAAEIVQMDDPCDLGLWINGWAFRNGIKEKGSESIKGIAFIENFPKSHLALAQNCYLALEAAFAVKYFYGRPRPEESLKIGAKFTHSELGAPNHPAYVAGHGAVCGATYAWFESSKKATAAQLQIVKQTCLQFAMFRTFSGYHYANDNLEGFDLGYRIVKDAELEDFRNSILKDKDNV